MLGNKKIEQEIVAARAAAITTKGEDAGQAPVYNKQ
jgi:hypothetical protein